MRILKTAAIIIVITQFAACANSRQFVPLASMEPETGKSAICVLRKNTMLGAANGADVWVDENLIASLGPGGYVLWESKPGPVKIRMRMAGVSVLRISSEIEIAVESGKVHFIMAEPTVGPYVLREIGPDEGKSVIKQYKAARYLKR